MIKKTDQVRSLVRQGRYKDALRIAKGFRLGITREQSDTMVRAYECMVHPDFYRSIGKHTGVHRRRGSRFMSDIWFLTA